MNSPCISLLSLLYFAQSTLSYFKRLFLIQICHIHLILCVFIRCLAKLEKCWKYMQMETYEWRLEARHGRSIRRASQPSPWRWTPTSWQPRTPTNLEVRPLPWRGGSSLTLQLQLLLPAFVHSFFPVLIQAFLCMHLLIHSHSLSGSFQQCWDRLSIFFLNVPLHNMILHVDSKAFAAQQTFVIISTALNSLLIFSLHVFISAGGRLTIWCFYVFVWSDCTAWRDILTHSCGFALSSAW